jgi:hypothetical protein
MLCLSRSIRLVKNTNKNFEDFSGRDLAGDVKGEKL